MCDAENMFRAQVDADHHTGEALKRFADWLDKIGDPRAPGYVWMVENNKRPCHTIEFDSLKHFTWHNLSSKEDIAEWASIEEVKAPVLDEYILERDIWIAVMRSARQSVGYFCGFETAKEAEEALCKVLSNHPEFLVRTGV